MENKLSLLICGTQISGSGIQKLVSVGSLPLEDKQFPSCYQSAEYYVECRHCADYIRYSLYINPNKVRSFDVPRDGRLSLTVAIDKNFRISGGKNPFGLLLEIWNKFREEFMKTVSPVPGASWRYVFKDVRIPNQAFDSLLADCKLVSYDGRYVMMNGTEPADLVLPSESMIGQLLADTQYHELSQYSCLRVATNGSVQNSLSLEIPRRPRYDVIVNGIKRGTICGDEPFSQTIVASNPAFQDAMTLKFTLSELLPKGQCKGGSWEIDERNECVRFDVTFSPKIFRRRIQFYLDGVLVDEERAKGKCQMFELYAKTNGGVFPVKDLSADEKGVYVEFKGRELIYDWQVRYKGESKQISIDYNHDRDSYRIEDMDSIYVKKLELRPTPHDPDPVPVPAPLPEKEGRCLLLRGIDRLNRRLGRVTVTVEYTINGGDNRNRIVRFISPFSGFSELNIPLEAMAEVRRVRFSSDLIEDKEVAESGILFKGGCYILEMPYLIEGSFWTKFRKKAEGIQLFEKVMIFIIGLALGIGGFYLVNHFCAEPESPKATESGSGLSDGSGGDGEDGSCIEGESDPCAGVDDAHSSSGGATASGNTLSAVSNKVRDYISRMKEADIYFNEVDSICNFSKSAEAKNEKDIDNLKKWAELYKSAKDVIVQIKTGSIRREDAVRSLDKINKSAQSLGNELKPFRASIQALLIRDGHKEDDDEYLKYIYNDPNSSTVTSKWDKFSVLVTSRDSWIKKN